jgi:phospholipid-transporting ATPase
LTDLEKPENKEYLRCLALCHGIIMDGDKYNAASPDELALVNFAKMCGVEYAGMTGSNEMILEEWGKEVFFELLHVLEFNSDRKRMSVIVKTEEQEIILICKGADNKIIERSNNIENRQEMVYHVEKFAKEGLRTLLIAKRVLTDEEYQEFNKKYSQAKTIIGESRAEEIKKVQEEIEQNMTIIGATAIEDKLQDEIADTIHFLKSAGIKIWVLTGDKIETAMTIGRSTKLLSERMNIIRLTNIDSLKSQLVKSYKRLYSSTQKISERSITEFNYQMDNLPFALIISGDSLISISKSKFDMKILGKIAIKCEAVLCCRVSPKQKAEIVKMLRRVLPRARTLSIGDGANDVNMITEAHIGIGIRGVEGQQAARASDYSIGEFKHLKRLMVYYGRESYRKNAMLVLYTFWKNILLVFPQFWLSLFSRNFSGMPLYEKYMYQLFNILYASVPIIIFSVYDKELPVNYFMRTPSLYRGGLKKIYFNFWIFLLWVVRGLIHSFFICLFSSYLSYEINHSGHTFNFSELGITIYFFICFFVNSNIYVISNSFSILSNFIIIFAIFALIFSIYLISLIKMKIEYGLFEVIFTNIYFYVASVALFVIITLFDVLFQTLNRIIFFNFVGVDIGGEEDNDDEENLKLLETEADLPHFESSYHAADPKDAGGVNKESNIHTKDVSRKNIETRMNYSSEENHIIVISKPNKSRVPQN